MFGGQPNCMGGVHSKRGESVTAGETAKVMKKSELIASLNEISGDPYICLNLSNEGEALPLVNPALREVVPVSLEGSPAVLVLVGSRQADS